VDAELEDLVLKAANQGLCSLEELTERVRAFYAWPPEEIQRAIMALVETGQVTLNEPWEDPNDHLLDSPTDFDEYEMNPDDCAADELPE
jgi:hypothetical protein